MTRVAGAGLVVLSIGLVTIFFAWSVIETSTARVSGATGSSSFLNVGTLSLDSDVDSTELLFDADGLYPGPSVSGCVDVAYDGTLPGSIRVHGTPADATGLEDYVDITFTRSRFGVTCEHFEDGGEELFAGLLVDFWRQHPNYGSGLILSSETPGATRFAIRATGQLLDDNRAQGLKANFLLTVEVRP